MRFFKENSESIIKLYINQIGIAIFAMFLYTAAGALSEKITDSLAMKILISVFSVAFYFVLVYNVAWEIGAKDKIRIDGKRATSRMRGETDTTDADQDNSQSANPYKKTEKKGILLGIFANVPNFVIVGISIILSALYIATEAEVLKTIFAILNFLFRFFLSMYLGVIQGMTASIADENTMFLIQTVLFFAFSALAAVITHVSYVLGLKDFRFFATPKAKK